MQKPAIKNLVKFFKLISHFSSIPRMGAILWEGIPSAQAESLADHKTKVSCILMILGDLARAAGYPVEMEHLLRRAILHDWGELVLGDFPTSSPSYQSYFKNNIE